MAAAVFQSMTMKMQLLGVVAILAVVVLLTLEFWPADSLAPGQAVAADPVVDAEPAKIEPVTGAASPPESQVGEVVGQGRMERQRVDSEPEAGIAAVRLLVVRGVVSNPNREPIAGATVSVGAAGKRLLGKKLVGSGGKSPAGAPGSSQHVTTTMADGSYQLELTVKAGREYLWLVAENFGSLSREQRLAITGEELTADFELGPAFVVGGRVVDPDGVGIADAGVRTLRNKQEQIRTDPEGYFRIGDVDPNSKQVYLEATARGFVTAGEVVAIEGESVDDVLIELSPGALVRGVVQGPGQQPIAKAMLTLTTAGRSKSPFRVLTESDDIGHFEFSAVPTGRSRLAAQHSELAASMQSIDVPPPGQILELVVQLAKGRVLRGVVHEEGGGPIAGATVRARSSRNPKDMDKPLRSVETDERGVFEMSGLPLGELLLWSRAEGFVRSRWQAVDASSAYQEIVLARAARIAGTVVDALTGEPVPKFSVRMRGEDEKGRLLRFGSELGQWQSPPLRAGDEVDVEVRAKGYAPTVVEGLQARVDADYDDCRIGLSAGVTLHGLVETEAGIPLADTRLLLARGGDEPAAAPGKGGGDAGRSTRSDAAGRFSFDNVPTGETRITVERSDTGVFVHVARIPEHVGDWRVTIRVQAQGELRGIVREPDGRFAVGADVAVTTVEVPGLGERVWREKTDEAGRFVFPDLPFGVYRVARTESEGKRLETFARHVAVIDRTPLEVELVATGVATFGGTMVADVPVPEGTLVRLTPVYEEDVPVIERSAPRNTRADGGAFLFEGLEPGPYRLLAFFFDTSAEQWVYGQVDVEVEEAGATQFVLTLDSRK